MNKTGNRHFWTPCCPKKQPAILKKKWIRIHTTRPALVFFSLFLGITEAVNRQDKEKLNILFIISDDLTTTALSNYENCICMTPHIEKLASRGMHYTRDYIQYGKDAGSGIELFDMDHDPKQYNNLADNPQSADIVEKFKKRLQDKLKEVRDNDLEID